MKKAVRALILLICVARAVGQQTTNQSPISVVILPFRNSGSTSNLSYSTYSLQTFLQARLEPIKSFKILPTASVAYAIRELKLQAHELPKPEQIRRIGEIIEAENVIYGSYDITNGGLTIKGFIMNVVDGTTQQVFSVRSIAEFGASTNMVESILSALKVTATEEERIEAERPLSSSASALEMISEAMAASQKPELFSTAEADIRKALEFDPHCAIALEYQSQIFMVRGKGDEAMESARLAVKYQPSSASAHCALGTAYCFQQMLHVATDEYLEAIRLGPHDPDNYYRLGEVYRLRSRWDDAISAMQRAIAFSPYDAGFHAELGLAYSFVGKRSDALDEFASAERYKLGSDPLVLQALASGYDQLSDAAAAVKYYDEYFKLASLAGINSQREKDCRARSEFLKSSLVPKYITVSEPKSFDADALAEYLRNKLSKEEYKLIINPLNCNTNMAKWAFQLVAGAKDDEDKARLLFSGLEHRANFTLRKVRFSALEVFNNWTNLDTGLVCQDYTLLYVALARSVGLKAYFVTVNQDYEGTYVLHACAGVILGSKAVLVDPMYEWFGVPHKSYQFQNDTQVTAILLGQTDDIERRMLAIKLYPDWPIGYFSAALMLAQDGEVHKAREILQEGLKFDSKSWISLYAQAQVEVYEENWSAVVEHARECLSFKPSYVGMKIAPHYALAMGLWRKDDLTGARRAFLDYLKEDSALELTEEAYAAIALIDKSLRDRAVTLPTQ